MTKFCNRCKLAIDTEKERYIKVEDNEGKKNLNKLWFHKNCWSELMTSKNDLGELQKKAMKFMNFAGKKIGLEEEYSVN